MPHSTFRPSILTDGGALFLACLLCAATALAARAGSPSSALERADIRSAAAELAELLEGRYVFPNAGERYATHLREQAAAGAYDGAATAGALAARFEAELNALHPDAHLRVTATDSTDEAAPNVRRLEVPRRSALSGARWIADDIAYVAVNLLPGDEVSQQAMAGFLSEHEAARALVLDLRSCPGGTLPVMDVLFAHLFSQRTHLVTMDTRVEAEQAGGAIFSDLPSLTREAAPDGIVRRYHWALPKAPASPLADKPVYVLTGGTGSACEHLALALKASGRATLVGSVTGGAGHYGSVEAFGGGRFEVFVPVGRTFDPQTGRDWEGTGVSPHLETRAEDALDRALAELGVEREAPPVLADAESYVGVYGNRRITLEDGTLFLQRVDVPSTEGPGAGAPRRIAPKLEMRPLGGEQFELPRVPGAKVRFERDETGRVARIAVQQLDGRWEEAARSSGG
jgi:hypothetical protein